MDSKKNPDWEEEIVRTLLGRHAKISLSLMKEKNIISLYSDENRAELILSSPDEVKIVVGGTYRGMKSREEIVETLIGEIKGKKLLSSKEIEKAFDGGENLFGAFVKLEALLKKNSQRDGTKTRKSRQVI